jgi:hypothetical protein
MRELFFIVKNIQITQLSTFLSNSQIRSEMYDENGYIYLTIPFSEVKHIELNEINFALFVEVPFFDAFFTKLIDKCKYNGFHNLFSIIIKAIRDDIISINDIPDYLKDVPPEIRQFIKIFIRNNLNISKTAKELYFHRNTVINKVDEYSNLINIDLKNSSNALFLSLLLNL